jgi:WD40 repeat protein
MAICCAQDDHLVLSHPVQGDSCGKCSLQPGSIPNFFLGAAAIATTAAAAAAAARYRGHLSIKTVKDVSFVGPGQGMVAAGSDDGRLLIWDRHTGAACRDRIDPIARPAGML